MIEPSDEDLVARVVAARDAAAFEVLVRRYQAKVRNWLRQLTRDSGRADDLAQETFIRAWERAHTYNGSGSFASWLMKVAYNQHLQAVRKRRQQGRLVDAVASDASDPSPTAHADEWPDAAKMLAMLSEHERLAMILCYAHGMSHAEIGAIVGMPIGTIKSHIHRAKAKIRERFAVAAASGANGPRG